jgi:hypothetical protein
VADGVGGIGSSLSTRRGGCASAGVPRLIDIRRQTRNRIRKWRHRCSKTKPKSCGSSWILSRNALLKSKREPQNSKHSIISVDRGKMWRMNHSAEVQTCMLYESRDNHLRKATMITIRHEVMTFIRTIAAIAGCLGFSMNAFLPSVALIPWITAIMPAPNSDA